ncbi:MAG: serine/threonine protein kinase [Myxococcales bacterium]|nr:serine/threonine protein kinase [Myxococcales bacterium]
MSTSPHLDSAGIGAQDATLPAPTTGVDAAATSQSRGELGDARFVDHFALLRKLGEGGMGVVYAAFDEALGRRVALKLLHVGDPLRLLREAQALARLSHPNVVQIYAVGRFREQVYVAMEYVEGPTLDALAPGRGAPARGDPRRLHPGRSRPRGRPPGRLVHRDFKPSNVLVGDDGRVRVLDFGLARAGDSAGEGDDGAGSAASDASLTTTPGRDALQSPLTVTGALMGTPAYMSPEQHRGARVDGRSDLFSFCVALFEALHGRRPFDGDDIVTIATNVLDGAIVATPPRPGVLAAVDAALRRGLAVEPDARWPSMDALLAALERPASASARAPASARSSSSPPCSPSSR